MPPKRWVWQRLTAACMLLLTGCTPTAPRPPGDIARWAVYYNDALPASEFDHLDMVVFDRRHYPDFTSLKGKTKVLAYISIGEVYDDVPEKVTLEKARALLYQNERWKSHAVDITAPVWHSIVMGYVADAAAKGFDGVMLDTLDSPLYWAETKAPNRQKAIRKAATSLIASIRRTHPTMKIVLNRGFSVLPTVAGHIDYALAESILTNTDVSTGQFALNSPNTFYQAAKQLQTVVALAPQLQILTLDYWNSDDVIGMQRIYATQREQGFIPYVTTPELRDFTPEPIVISRK